MKVLYFTGTGNSKYAAERIAEIAGAGADGASCAELVDLRPLIKAGASYEAEDEDIVVCTPVYAWRTPRVLEDWLRQSADLSAARRIWYVLTCGDSIGAADKYNAALSADLGCQHMGTAKIIMPENYIAMFNAPFEEEARRIVADAEESIDAVSRLIASGEPIPPVRNTIGGRASSAVVNGVFYSLFIKDKAFRAEEGCIGCGKCAELCPMNNIVMAEGRPVWQGNCTHCMACICYCPAEAIEYGKSSTDRFRYSFERLGYSRENDYTPIKMK